MHPNHVDPVSDVGFPSIVEFDSRLDECEHFPDGWGEVPTERDKAVIETVGDTYQPDPKAREGEAL